VTFLFQKQDPLDLVPSDGVDKPIGGVMENLSAAFNVARSNDQAYSEATVLRDQWATVVDTINERTGMDSHSEFLGVKIRTFMHDGFSNPANVISSSMLNATATPGASQHQYMINAQKIVDYIKENKDIFPDLQWVTHEEILRRGMEQAKQDRETLQELEGRSPGALNTIARFIGGMGGVATDPINVETVFIAGGARTLYGAIFREAMLGAGVEAMSQTGVKEWYKKLGFKYTPEQFWTAVAMGGAFGGAMPVAFRAGGRTISLTADQFKKGYKALVESGAFKPTSVTRTAERQAEILEGDAANNPLTDELAHQERLDLATVAAENAEPPAMPDTPPAPVRAKESVYDADNIDGLIYRFDPTEIQVDAQTFQFKAGGDEFGVSERLQGVTQWDPIKAGQITVFEYADGSRFIADGHQRLGLAKRIKSQDPDQDVRLYGHLLREVDGVTPEMARVIAAVKNIAEGTGTAIDAAKVLRVAPERVGELPPRSALVRQAQGLTMLSDEAFGAVVNNVVPANYAALVGRLIPEDEGLQNNAISVLAKTDPANEFQAEAIVRQVREAGGERVTQDSLFGEEVITESYFAERARILDRAQKQLRQDKNAFQNLVNNAERLEAEGNQLAKNANERRAANDAQTIAILQALANRKGPVSDALNAAARAARESGSYAEPTRNFVDSVRLAAESGDIDRISTGDVGQLIDAPTEGRTPPLAERAVEDFDEPGGAGVRQQGDQLEQDIFGAADPAPQPVREADIPDANLKGFFDSMGDEGALLEFPTISENINKYIYDVDRKALDVAMRSDEYSDYADVLRANLDRLFPGEKIPVSRTEGYADLRPGPEGRPKSFFDVDKKDVLFAGYDAEKELIVRFQGEPMSVRIESPAQIEVRIPDDQVIRLQDIDFAEAKAIGLQARANQNIQSVDELMERAARNHSDLTAEIGRIADAVGAKQKVASLKERKRVDEKIRDKYAGDINRVTDVARGGIEVETNEIADAFVAAIGKRYKVIDEGYNFTPEGYFDRKLSVIFDDGQIGEIQIWPLGMLDAKGVGGGHALYRIARDLSQPEEARAKAVADMQQLYSNVANKLSDSWKAILARQTPSGMDAPSRAVNEATRSRVTSGDPSSPSTSEALIGDQLPVVDKDTISPLDVSMAGMDPSTKKNLIESSSDNIDIANQNIKLDLDEEIPVDLRVDPETGEIVAQTVSLRQIQNDIEQDVKMLDRLRGCVQ